MCFRYVYALDDPVGQCCAGEAAEANSVCRDEFPAGGDEVLPARLPVQWRQPHPFPEPGHPPHRCIPFLALKEQQAPVHVVRSLGMRLCLPSSSTDNGFYCLALHLKREILGSQLFLLKMKARALFKLSAFVWHTEGEYRATGNVWLCPQTRLLADSPQATDYVYNGQGRCLILPEGISDGEALPLIIVGAGKTLLLRDVKIVHAASMPACLQLGSGQHIALPTTLAASITQDSGETMSCRESVPCCLAWT